MPSAGLIILCTAEADWHMCWQQGINLLLCLFFFFFKVKYKEKEDSDLLMLLFVGQSRILFKQPQT